MNHELRLFAVALMFLTRIPLPASIGWRESDLNDSARYFPLVGGLVGLVSALVLVAASLLWPPFIAATLSITATVLLTGAFHEDGLADSFDALGGVVSRERALAIMKDSRIGSYGALALGLSLALRIGLLTTLCAQPALACLALVLAHSGGRMAAVAMMAVLPYAGDAEHAKAKPLATQLSAQTQGIALGTTVVQWGLAAALIGLPLVLVTSLAVVGVVCTMRHWLLRRLGGYTGDTLGATEQLSEIAVLSGFAALMSPA